MAQRYRPAVDIDPALIPLQHFPYRKRLGSKGFIDFDQIDIRQLPPCPLQAAARRMHRGYPH
ncbi:hypothetical protein D3C76_1707430 [compost metagenome]